MNQARTARTGPDTVWERYRDNSSRHLLGVAHYLQTSLMKTLREQCGHAHLRLGFAPYISLIGERGRRLTDLAQALGISRQACNQAIRPIEAAGYIAREADPQDGRAKTVSLTPNGVKLRRDGLRIVARLDREFSGIAGDDAFRDAAASLGRLFAQLVLDSGQAQLPNGSGMGALLPALSDYTQQRLMQLTQARGHGGLRMRFGQVLTLIGPSGGRIQQIAAIHDVSKQAISAIAMELETLGYLRRETDPLDARQLVLKFTRRGDRLIADSVDSVAELEMEYAAILGQAALARMNATLRALYHGLRLEQDVFEQRGTSDIGQLAERLQQQLGEHGSQALARLLLIPSGTSR